MKSPALKNTATARNTAGRFQAKRSVPMMAFALATVATAVIFSLSGCEFSEHSHQPQSRDHEIYRPEGTETGGAHGR